MSVRTYKDVKDNTRWENGSGHGYDVSNRINNSEIFRTIDYSESNKRSSRRIDKNLKTFL